MGTDSRGVAALPALALAIMGVVVACSPRLEGAAPSAPQPLTLPVPAGSHDPQPESLGRFVFYPNSGHVTQNVAYQFRLYTHCGLNNPTGPDFDGSFWESAGAADDGSGNPPPGFGNPIDNGTMRLLSANLAEYRSSQGVTVRFSRHSGSKVASPCS